ncbi:MAG: c-type cytochrome domain-containing protein [Gemmataceae bacterium]
MTPHRTAVLVLLVALPVHAAAPAPAPPPTYEAHVRPILKAYCLECHGEGKTNRGGLDLRLRRLAVDGGDSGPAIVPGKPEASLLFQRVGAHEMPPGGKSLSAPDVDTLRRWIAAGAPTARPEPERIPPGLYLTDDERAFWSFQPIRRPPVPTVRHRNLVRTPIDAFLLARLEGQGLSSRRRPIATP